MPHYISALAGVLAIATSACSVLGSDDSSTPDAGLFGSCDEPNPGCTFEQCDFGLGDCSGSWSGTIFECDQDSNQWRRAGYCEPPRPCVIPDGTYGMAISALSGDCPTTLIDDLQLIFDDAAASQIIAGGECGPITGSATVESITHGCALTLSFAADGTVDGVENGSGSLSATCESSPDCTQDVAIVFEREASSAQTQSL